MRGIFTIVICAVFTVSVSGQQVLQEIRGEATGSSYTDYYLHVPANPDASTGLIVFLHGNGPSNNVDVNTGWDRVDDEAMPLAMETTEVFNAYADDYYVLIPHHNAGAQGFPIDPTANEWIMPELKAFIDQKIFDWGIDEGDDFPEVDMDRIVIAGFSLGGKGVWDFAEAYPDFAAGYLPTWGSAIENGVGGYDWCEFDNSIIWAINGEEDGIFPPDGISTSGRYGVYFIEDAIFACNPNAPFNLTMLDARNHLGWDELFRMEMGYDVYGWMASLDKGTTDYIPFVEIGDNKTLVAATEYVVHAFALDAENESLSYTWLVEDVTGTLNVTYNVKEETPEYIYLEDLQVGRDYRVRLTVSDGLNSNFDEVFLSVISSAAYGGATLTGVNLLFDGGSIPFPTDDVFDIRDVTNKDGFNVQGVADINTFNVKTELNSARRYNLWGGSPFDYEDGTSGFGGSKFQLFQEGTRRMTFTFDMLNLGGAYQGTFQVTAMFTDDPDALPITLLSFTGEAADRGVQLDWSTTEEVGNSHFEVFRGRSGDDLAKVAEVPKAEPAKQYNYYSYHDAEATEGVYYYQLQSVDYDGHRDISDIIRVAVTADAEFTVYPNPSTEGMFRITFNENESADRPILYNSHGQQVGFSLAPSPSGPGERQMILDNPRPGMYLLKVWHRGDLVTRKVMVE